MCFGSRTSSIFSTSSLSSEEYNSRLIDIPTIRLSNSPRCAPRGAAYNNGAQAASERPGIRVPETTSVTTGELKQLHAL